MKTKKFIKRVNELGYQVVYVRDEDGNFNEISIFKDDEQIVTVWGKVNYAISTIFDDLFMPTLENNNLEELYELCFEYAQTPVEDRKEEKKFYLKHRYFKCTNRDSRYFQIYEPDGTPWLNAMYSVMGYKKQFTLKEIEEIKEEFDTDLKDFELVEVEE